MQCETIFNKSLQQGTHKRSMIWFIGIIEVSPSSHILIKKAEKIHLIFSPQSFEKENISKLSMGSLWTIIDNDDQVRILDMIFERVNE